ncbi:MAG: hypothetical protein HY748_17655 [Elusimicrobia bacterium]|nr:hypothetical protein [Elusimicrobiota bacterium]
MSESRRRSAGLAYGWPWLLAAALCCEGLPAVPPSACALGAGAAGWPDDNTARSDYERLGRRTRRGAGAPEFDTMRLSIRPWLSKGHGLFRAGYPFPWVICDFSGNPENCSRRLKSEVSLGYTRDFKEVEHPVMVFNYELRVHRRLSFDVEVAGSDYGRGRYHAHDWIQAPNQKLWYVPTDTWYDRPNYQDWALEESRLKGDTRMLSSNAYFRVFIHPSRRPKNEEVIRQAFDVFAGYTLYQDTFRLAELSQIMANRTWTVTPPEGPVGGFDSKQRLRWEGFRLGIREELDLPQRFSLMGRFAYSPDLEFQGASYLNLQTDERQGDPSRVQTARGRSFDWAVLAGYSPWRFLSFELGYMWMYFKGGRGSEKVYYTDGSMEEIELEKVWSRRHGVFTGLTFKY